MIKRFTRVLYQTGQLLQASDLQDEQNYFREKLQLHNRLHFGARIMEGFDVISVTEGMIVTPGIAFDCLGRELVSDDNISVPVPKGVANGLFVLLEHQDFPVASQPSPTNVSGPTRVVEGVLAYTGNTDLHLTHPHTARGWEACAGGCALPIAAIHDGSPRRMINSES